MLNKQFAPTRNAPKKVVFRKLSVPINRIFYRVAFVATICILINSILGIYLYVLLLYRGRH